MQKWELVGELCESFRKGSGDVRDMWQAKDPKTGKTEWDIVKARAAQGWELVSVTPITGLGYTSQLLFVFKRLIEEDK